MSDKNENYVILKKILTIQEIGPSTQFVLSLQRRRKGGTTCALPLQLEQCQFQ